MNGAERKPSIIRSILSLIAIGIVVGAVLAGLYTLKMAFWQGRWITFGEFVAFVSCSVIGCLFLGFMDSRRKKRYPSLTTDQLPPENVLTTVCREAYAKALYSEFERWVPSGSQVGKLNLVVEQVLEDRTWNYQRAILFLVGEPKQGSSPEQCQQALRSYCREQLQPSRFRGLGIGIIIESKEVVPDIELLLSVVDERAIFPATIQWIVWYNRSANSVVGAHVPVECKTTPCFIDTCLRLKDEGLDFDCQLRPASGLLGVALKAQKVVPPWLHLLGP
jgi:hypothetical protein